MTTIITKNSSTASAVPTSSDLVQGELAVNVTDKRIYTENASGTVVELGTNPSIVTLPDGSASAPTLTNDGDTNTGVFFPAADTVAITTGGTERARIDSSGNLLVGTTSPDGKMCVQTSGNSYGVVSVNSTVATTSSVLFQGYATTSTRFLVYGNGNVVNTNNSYGAISDSKLKENIVDATPKLEKLNKVRVVNYNFIGEEQTQLGVIAQELEQVFPSMVDEAPDLDAKGNDLGTTTKSVKYSVFVPMLIKAIQEQQTLITQLQADVVDLTTQIAALKAA